MAISSGTEDDSNSVTSGSLDASAGLGVTIADSDNPSIATSSALHSGTVDQIFGDSSDSDVLGTTTPVKLTLLAVSGAKSHVLHPGAQR
jgi:hypothetical protein